MGTFGGHRGGSKFATVRAVAVTESLSNNTKGSWSQIWSSTPFEMSALHLNLRHGGSGTPRFLMDLGVGAGGSEVVVVPDLMVGRSLHSEMPSPLMLPLRIPAGVRLAARCQAAAGGSNAITATCIGQAAVPGVPPGFGRCTQYGASTATSNGTDIDAGGVAHTKGSWSQLTASTTNPMRAVAVAMHFTGTAVNARWLVDIGIGAAASELVVIPDIPYLRISTADTGGPLFAGPFYCDIPAGTRIAARCQSDTTTSASRHLNIQVIGLD